MFSILPIIDFFLCFSIIAQAGKSVRESFLISSIVWAALALIVTGCLSSLHYVTDSGIAAAWFGIFIILILITLSRIFCVKPFSMPQVKIWHSLEKVEKIWLLTIIAFMVTTVVVAILSPPNSRDSLAYHMSRVMHWLQNKSVDPYPTSVMRQLIMPPLSEYIILQFQALLENDRFANLVQCFYLAGVCIAVSMLAKQFGADRKGQIFCALIAVTNPVALLQSASTLNDLGAAYWVVCALYFLIRIIQQVNFSFVSLIWFGLSISLAIATKGLYIFCSGCAVRLAIYKPGQKIHS